MTRLITADAEFSLNRLYLSKGGNIIRPSCMDPSVEGGDGAPVGGSTGGE